MKAYVDSDMSDIKRECVYSVMSQSEDDNNGLFFLFFVCFFNN